MMNAPFLTLRNARVHALSLRTARELQITASLSIFYPIQQWQKIIEFSDSSSGSGPIFPTRRSPHAQLPIASAKQRFPHDLAVAKQTAASTAPQIFQQLLELQQRTKASVNSATVSVTFLRDYNGNIDSKIAYSMRYNYVFGTGTIPVRYRTVLQNG